MARNKADNDFVMSHDLACIWRMEKGIAQSLENDNNMNIGDQCEAWSWMREFATNSFELDKDGNNDEMITYLTCKNLKQTKSLYKYSVSQLLIEF